MILRSTSHLLAAAALIVSQSAGSLTKPSSLDIPLPVAVAVGAWQFPMFATWAISPDGRILAYSLQEGTRIRESVFGVPDPYTRTGVPRNVQGCDIWLTDLHTGRTKNLTAQLDSSNWAPVWSSSGRDLAFFSDRGGSVHVWLWDRKSDHIRRVSSAIIHPDMVQKDAAYGMIPNWVDDDRKLLVPLLPQGVTVADADRFVSGYVVQHDGHTELAHTTIHVYVNDPKAVNNGATLARLQGYGGYSNGNLFDYALIDVSSGVVTRIVSHTTAVAVAVSDDRRYAVLMTQEGSARDAHDQSLYDLDVISFPSARHVLSIYRLPLSIGWPPSWQPRTDSFAYTTGAIYASLRSREYGQSGQTYLVSALTHRIRMITAGNHPDFGLYMKSTAWSPDGRRLYYVANNRIWIADVAQGIVNRLPTHLSQDVLAIVTSNSDQAAEHRDAIYVVLRDPQTKREGLASIDVGAGAVVATHIGDWAIGGYPGPLTAAAPDESSIAYAAEDATHPWDIWVIDASLQHARQLTVLNPLLDRYRYGRARLISWRLPDGSIDQGAIILPSDYIAGLRYPTIVYQYPASSKSNNLNDFGGDEGGVIWGNFQLYATRGYAVFLPDMTWKEQAEADLTNGHAMLWLNSMLDKLIATGISDPQRFGIEGFSHGGYSTIAFITQTHRFRAAIADSGFSSELSMYTEFSPNGNAFYVNETERGVGGTPWTRLHRFVAMSPFFKLDSVTTPILIVQGSDAQYVQEKEGDETFVALRRLNKEATYVIYEGEGHSRWSFSYLHELDYWTRAIDWYDKYLK